MNEIMKAIKIFLLLILLSAGIFSQEVKPLNSTKDLDELKESLKGKVALVNFWATWCAPCVKEFPDLIKLYNNYKDKDFKLVFITTDVPEEIESKVIPFLKKNNVDFVTYYNNFQNVEELINYIDKDWEGAIPSTYIYNKDGKVTSSFLGKKEYSEFEKEILKNLN
ncbi:MAG: TlpA family protein disulfide reductase [Ignavibacteriae bacterium]|nr:MAG: TlpA family protein disulfide reductase [Ignavibacteriota bacterium]